MDPLIDDGANDQVLLEGLFQLASIGDTQSSAYAHLEAEVYSRFYSAYAQSPDETPWS